MTEQGQSHLQKPGRTDGNSGAGIKHMKLRVLCVNPWIYDFAAANLWASPLGLTAAAGFMRSFDTELSFIDCLDSHTARSPGGRKYPKTFVQKPSCLQQIPRRYGRYGISIDEFRIRLISLPPADVVFMTSVMSYWYPGVQQAVALIRELRGSIPVVLGGIYATLWPGHASGTSGADLIYRGPISESIGFGLATFGFRLRKVRRKESPRFGTGLSAGSRFAPLLTSFGCPFRCAYCGSSLLHGTFMQRDPFEVAAEIISLHKDGVRDVAFYDDALLLSADTHIKVFLREVIRSGIAVRFHCPNGLHARFIDAELARLMNKAGFAEIRLSLETVDRDRQRTSGGKVSTDDLERAVRELKRQGFRKEQIGVYIMYGLPGQGLEEVRRGAEFLKGLDVRVHLTEFSPVPGTGSWEELKQLGIISDATDPLLTNNTVFSYLFSGYDQEEMRQVISEVKEHNMSLRNDSLR